MDVSHRLLKTLGRNVSSVTMSTIKSTPATKTMAPLTETFLSCRKVSGNAVPGINNKHRNGDTAETTVYQLLGAWSPWGTPHETLNYNHTIGTQQYITIPYNYCGEKCWSPAFTLLGPIHITFRGSIADIRRDIGIKRFPEGAPMETAAEP